MSFLVLLIILMHPSWINVLISFQIKRHILTLKTHLTLFLQWNTKQDILNNVHSLYNEFSFMDQMILLKNWICKIYFNSEWIHRSMVRKDVALFIVDPFLIIVIFPPSSFEIQGLQKITLISSSCKVLRSFTFHFPQAFISALNYEHTVRCFIGQGHYCNLA